MTDSPTNLPAPSACARCGACTAVCPVFRATGRETFTARGKLHLLNTLGERGMAAAMADILGHCLLCGACSARCPRGLAPHILFEKLRTTLAGPSGTPAFYASLVRSLLARPGLAAGITAAGRAVFDLLPADSGMRLRLRTMGILPETVAVRPLPKAAGKPATLNYFSGCLSRHLRRDIGAAVLWSASTLGGHTPRHPESQTCCGLAALTAGDRRQATKLARANIESFAGNDLPILTSCASCYSHLRRYPDLFADDRQWHRKATDFAGRLREYTTWLLETDALRTLRDKPAVTPLAAVVYHDPCHLRFHENITTPPRALLRCLPGVDLRELPSGPQCCGQGGMFYLLHPGTANRIRSRLVEDILATEAELVLSSCSGCLLHLRQALYPTGIRGTHPALFLMEHFF